MKTKKILLTLTATLFAGSLAAQQAGDLDSTFGVNGVVVTDFGDFEEQAYAMVIQSNGKIVIAGSFRQPDIYNSSDFVVIRYNSNGSLDTSFGTGGITSTSLTSDYDAVYSMALQPDGKIIVAGVASKLSNGYFGLARYNENGTLDTSFNSGGVVITDLTPDLDIAYSVSLQVDGKIVVAGHAGFDCALARYNVDGTLDNSFGTGGKVIFNFSSYSDQFYALAIQGDGKIVAAGRIDDRIGLIRCHSNGILDSTFSSDGIEVVLLFSLDNITDVTILSNGKIVAVGGFMDSSENFVLFRYKADGTLDSSFNMTGIQTTDFTRNERANSVAIQPDGKIVVAGYSSGRFALARYNDDGTLDNRFGVNGKVVGTDGHIKSVAIQADGRIVAAGYTGNEFTEYDFALTRYLSGLNVGIIEFSQSENNVLIYPNPITHSATLEYTLTQPETITIRLLDLQGKTVKTFIENTKREAGAHQQTVTLPATLSAGSYLIMIESEKGRMGVKVNKV